MAVTMSGATIDNSVREDLKGKSIDVTSTGGNPLEMAFGFKAGSPTTFGDVVQTVKRNVNGATGAQAGLAGITEAFAGHVATEIENYKANVQNLIDQLKNENSKGNSYRDLNERIKRRRKKERRKKRYIFFR